VERRKQDRLEVAHPVTVTVLDEPPIQLSGQVVNMSGGGFRLLTTEKIRLNAAVRVDMADAVLLGEVCYCVEEEAGEYAVGLESQQILSHTRDLARLMQSLAGEPKRESKPVSDSSHAILSNE
jgi:hypothetical protein